MDKIIAGALFDFAGYLTTLEKPITIGSMYEAPILFEQLLMWASQRKLSLENPSVKTWEEEKNAVRTH